MTQEEVNRLEAKEQKRARRAAVQQFERERAVETAGGSGWNWKGVGGLIFAVILVIRVIVALSRSGSSSSTPPPYQSPAYTQPTYSQQQLREFHQYDPRSGKPEPPGYMMFKLTGGSTKPAATTPTRPR